MEKLQKNNMILLTILCMKNKKYLNNDLYSFNINLNYLKI